MIIFNLPAAVRDSSRVQDGQPPAVDGNPPPEQSTRALVPPQLPAP